MILTIIYSLGMSQRPVLLKSFVSKDFLCMIWISKFLNCPVFNFLELVYSDSNVFVRFDIWEFEFLVVGNASLLMSKVSIF